MRRKKIFQLTFSILFTTLLVIGLVYAWTAPSQNPPAGNVEAPINVSDSAQSKLGNFGLGGGVGQPLYWLKNIGGTLYFSSTDPSGDRVVIGQDGNVGIGKNDPQAKLHVNGRIKAQDPIDDDDVATKAYVDAHASTPYIDWSDCQVKSAKYCTGPGGRTISCDNGYVAVDSLCGGMGSYGTRGSGSGIHYAYGYCKLTGPNELYIYRDEYSYGKGCIAGSLKCCKYVTP